MKSSETIGKLTQALVKAQAQMGAASKAAANPFFKSKYADLPSVMEVVKGPLNDNGLAVLQPGTYRDGKNFIETIILHSESGEYIVGETEVVVPTAKANDPQAHGSAQTYARRFGLQAMLFIPSEDKDAEDLMSRGSQHNKPAYQHQASTVKSTPVAPPATAPVALTPQQELANDPTPTGEPLSTVAPLQKSSFRKGPAIKGEVPVAAVVPTESEWG